MAKDSDETRREKNNAKARRYRATDKAKATYKQWLAKPGNRKKQAERQAKHRRWLSGDRPHKDWQRQRDTKYLLAGRPRPDACDICGRTQKAIVYDHCHKRGHFRGWLCRRCNCVLGMVRDDPRLLAQLIAYLQRTRHNTSPQLTLGGL